MDVTSNCPHFSQHLKTWVSVRFWKCGQIGLSAPRNRTPKSRSDVADSFEKGNCPQHLNFGSWLGFGSGFKLKPLHPTPKIWVPVRCGRWTIQVPLFSTPQIWVSVRFWKCDPTTKKSGSRFGFGNGTPLRSTPESGLERFGFGCSDK